MADLNALIAQGAQFQAPPDPFVQYGRMQQLEQGQQANQLNRMKMQEAQRAIEETNALRRLDPTSATYLQDVTKINPDKGFEYGKQVAAAAASKATQERQNVDASAARQGMLGQAYRDISSRPSDANITAHMEDVDASMLFNPEEKKAVKKLSETLLTLPFEQRGAFLASQGAKTSDLIVKPTPTPLSDTARLIKERDALPPGDPNRALYDRQIADLGATAQNARDRLAFDREKLAYERANPGKTIKEVTQADGSTQVFAIDNRTGMATQVMMAGAPGAAPAGGGRGAVGVPGGQVGPATPLVGAAKLGALTEAQGNAALFGSAMAQAQVTFDQVEKRGTKTGSVTTSLAQGIVKYVPLGVGDKLVGDVYALAMQDPTKLFGPDVDQQKLGQAQLAFSIAYLRKTSGAAFGPSELANTVNEYFPQIGEDASVTRQKSEARKRAIRGMKISAGKEGSKFIEEYEAPGAAGGEWKVVK